MKRINKKQALQSFIIEIIVVLIILIIRSIWFDKNFINDSIDLGVPLLVAALVGAYVSGHDFNHAIGTPAENGRPHSRACPVLGRFHAENRPRAPNRLLPYGEKHWCGSVSVHLDLGSVRSLEHEAHPRRRRAQARRSTWRIQAHSGKTWGHNVEAVVGADQANTLSWCPLETSHSLVECAFLLRR